MKIGLVILGSILLIPFIATLTQLAIRDAKGKGYCNSLFDTYLIPITVLTIAGSSLISWGIAR